MKSRLIRGNMYFNHVVLHGEVKGSIDISAFKFRVILWLIFSCPNSSWRILSSHLKEEEQKLGKIENVIG